MNHYVMHDIETDGGKPNDPKVMAKTYGRVEAEMLTAVLNERQWGPVFIVTEASLGHVHEYREAVASFEVDGPDPKLAVQVEIVRALLAREEDEGDLRRAMMQRLLVEDEGMDRLWKPKLLNWVMRSSHKPGARDAGDMETFERQLAEGKAEHDEWMRQMQAENEARQGN